LKSRIALTDTVSPKNNRKTRFLLVGIWNTIFGYFAFFLLDVWFETTFSSRQGAYMAALLLAQITSITNAFVLHRYYTFRSKTTGLEAIKEYFRFVSLYWIVFTFKIALMPLFVEIFGIHPRIAGALLMFLTIVSSYFGHSRFSFKD